MANMNVFSQDAFSLVSMTAAINNQDFQPTMLRNMGLFTPVPIRTEHAEIEEQGGTLKVIQTSERGAPLGQRTTEKRKVHLVPVPRIAESDSIRASEIAGIRQFGTESELMQVQDEVTRRMNGPAGLMRNVELTWENMAMGAVQGIVYDADGSVVVNWYTTFGLTADTAINFNFSASNPASGAIRKLCTKIVRQMQRGGKGAFLPTTTVVGLAGDDFWDALTSDQEVRETYLNQQEAKELRGGLAFEQFQYGGITWINYRGTDNKVDTKTGGGVGVASAEAKFFPSGAPGVFQTAYSPGEFFDVVNQPGQPVYALTVPDRDRNQFVDIEVYSYPLFMCTRPKMLQKAVAN